MEDKSKKRLAPPLRFRGFTDDWQQRRLGEECEFSKGRGYSKSDVSKSGTPLLLYGSLYTNYQTVIDAVNIYSTVKDNALLSKGGEVVVPASGETAEDIARASVIGCSGVIIGGDLNIIYPGPTLSPIFLALELTHGSCRKSLVKRAQGTSIIHIHNNDILDLETSSPSLPEQEKIGEFFIAMDELIGAKEAELEKRRQIKAALLEVMFPDEEGSTPGQSDEALKSVLGAYPELELRPATPHSPRLRFRGFSDDWQRVRLGDLAELNPVNQTLESEFFYIDLEAVEKGELKEANKCHKLSAPSRAQRTLQKDDLLFQTVRPYQRNHYFFQEDDTTHQWVASTGYALLRPAANPAYLYCIICSDSVNREVMLRCTGTAYPAIKSEDLGNIEVYNTPSLAEQERIGDFFRAQDESIAALGEQIEKLRTIKQACLEQMFV